MEPKQKRCVGLKYYDPVCLKVFSFASWVSNTDLLLEIVYFGSKRTLLENLPI